MVKYARYISNTSVSYPSVSEFIGIANWQSNDKKLRDKGYFPLSDVPPQLDGKTLVLLGFELVNQTIQRTVTRYREVTDYETDEEGKQIEVGKHIEPYEEQQEVDASFIRVTNWRYDDVIPPEPPDTSERDGTERQIVGLILQIAQLHDAINDILQMDDITIPNLEALAISKGVTLDSDEWRTLITSITPLKWQLEAIEDTTWARCWQGLKSRFQEYLQELQQGSLEK